MKEELLKKIAQKGYTIGFAANLNFSTYDIVSFVPGRIAFISIVVSILGLVWTAFSGTVVSVIFLILSIASIYIERFTQNIDSYAERGKVNTAQLNQLKNLYIKVKGMADDADFSDIERQYATIEQAFNEGSEPKQIAFAKWVAHYKLFCEKDVSWMDEQLHFGWWKDKVPQSAKFDLFLILIGIVVYYCCKVPMLNSFFKTILYLE